MPDHATHNAGWPACINSLVTTECTWTEDCVQVWKRPSPLCIPKVVVLFIKFYFGHLKCFLSVVPTLIYVYI